MINKKRPTTLISIPLVIVLVGVLITSASGDILAIGIAALIASAVYWATRRLQEKAVLMEHTGLAILMLILGALYVFERF